MTTTTNDTKLTSAMIEDPIDVAQWGDGPRWIVSTNGDAGIDQPRTEADLARSDRFHGPFETEHDACAWAADYGDDG